MFEEKPSVDNQEQPPCVAETVLKTEDTKPASQLTENNQKVLTATKHLRNDSKTIQLEMRNPHSGANDLDAEMTIKENGQMVLRHRRTNSNDLQLTLGHSRNNSRDSNIKVNGHSRNSSKDIKAFDCDMFANRRHSNKDQETLKNRDNERRSKSTTHSRSNSKDMKFEFEPKHRRTTSHHIQIENFDIRPEESLIPNLNFLTIA